MIVIMQSTTQPKAIRKKLYVSAHEVSNALPTMMQISVVGVEISTKCFSLIKTYILR